MSTHEHQTTRDGELGGGSSAHGVGSPGKRSRTQSLPADHAAPSAAPLFGPLDAPTSDGPGTFSGTVSFGDMSPASNGQRNVYTVDVSGSNGGVLGVRSVTPVPREWAAIVHATASSKEERR